jgi:V8-like Glu-specific endopeptidase
MWYHRERLRKVDRKRLYYTVDTCPGHSGSPIFTAPAGNRNVCIIGVHTSGILDSEGRSYGCGKRTVLAPPHLLNSGVRANRQMAAVIRNPVRKVFAANGSVRVGGVGA